MKPTPPGPSRRRGAHTAKRRIIRGIAPPDNRHTAAARAGVARIGAVRVRHVLRDVGYAIIAARERTCADLAAPPTTGIIRRRQLALWSARRRARADVNVVVWTRAP